MDENHDNECPTLFDINLENPEEDLEWIQANLSPESMTDEDIAHIINFETLVSIMISTIFFLRSSK